LKLQLSCMKRNPEIDVVLGRIRFTGMLTEADRRIRFEGQDNTMININLGSGVFKKYVFDKVGLFDESLRRYEDHDWFIRAREKDISIVILKDVTLYYRRNESSLSQRRTENDPSMIWILKKSLDRRRKKKKGSVELSCDFFDFDEGKTLQRDIDR
jgi:GT2 family glycosyltransferase